LQSGKHQRKHDFISHSLKHHWDGRRRANLTPHRHQSRFHHTGTHGVHRELLRSQKNWIAKDTIRYVFVLSLFTSVVTQVPVYYRVYTAEGDMPSKQPADPNDPSLGRIKVDSILSPRTVASMRRAISRVEEHFYHWHAKLFANMLSESPMDETHDPNLASFSLDQPLAFVLPTISKSKVSYGT
jgi:hypothetical protein